MMLSQFQEVGRELVGQGLVSSHSGNLSIRLGDRLLITRRGSSLGELREQDLIEMGLDRNNRATPLAGPELATHRAIYQKTPALAIVHAQPPHSVALSLTEKEIVPQDNNGQTLLSWVPVIRGRFKPEELCRMIAQALTENRIVLVAGLGSFARGQLLEEAYQCTTALEASCRILCLCKSLGSRVS